MKKEVKKGTTVICPIWDKTKKAKVNSYNPLNGIVSLRYKGSKAEYSANIDECKIL